MATIIYTKFTGTIAVCVAWVVFSLITFMNKLTSTTYIFKTCWTSWATCSHFSTITWSSWTTTFCSAGVVSIVGETLAQKVAAKQKLNENPTGVKEGAKAVKLMVNAFESLLKIAQDKIQEIIKEDPNMQQMYLDELKAAAKARADTNDVAPDIESDKKDGIVTDGRKPGLGQQIKDMFKNEWNYLKKQSGPILKLLTRIKISVGWTLPITLGGIVNPSLPGIGLVCAPLAPCLTELASAGSAILKALWTILTLPLKILWICIRTILEKVGGKIMKMLSRFSKQKEEIPEAAKEEIAKEEKDAGDSDEDLEEEPEDTGFGKSPIKTETTLVPISESKGYAMSVCKQCVGLICFLNPNTADFVTY